MTVLYTENQKLNRLVGRQEKMKHLNDDVPCLQVRCMSGGQRNFFQQVIDNIKQELNKNKEMKVRKI